MAPEQLISDKGYNHDIDIWSLGCCLYEIVTGNPPFQCDDIESMRRELLSSSEVKMKDYFSKEFVSLLNGLLEHNIAKRLTLT